VKHESARSAKTVTQSFLKRVCRAITFWLTVDRKKEKKERKEEKNNTD
jgi:hypothetical protein